MYQNITLEVRAGIGTLTLNRPERHNVFDDGLIAELSRAFAELDVHEGVRVAVTGAKACVFREPALEAALGRDFSEAAAQAVQLSSDGYSSDLHASAAYRAAMVSVMAGRAVALARGRG